VPSVPTDPKQPTASAADGWKRVPPPTPAAGAEGALSLGRDPYARGRESNTLLERQRRLLESDRTEYEIEVEAPSAHPVADEPKLSGLLSKREPAKGARAAESTDARGTGPGHADDEGPAANDEDEASERDRPRTWQLLGRD
jgi:hypothetical protein